MRKVALLIMRFEEETGIVFKKGFFCSDMCKSDFILKAECVGE